MPNVLPTTLIQSCTDGITICMIRWANEVTNGWWMPSILLGFMLVVFIATQKFGTARSFGIASFIGLSGSILMTIAGIMNWFIASAFIITGFVGLIAMSLNKE